MTRGLALSGMAALVLTIFTLRHPAGAQDADPVARGRKALETRAFTPGTSSLKSWDNLWRQWGDLKEQPGDYERAVRDRYGLHPAPYPNGRFPMGLREAPGLFGTGLTFDCMICHGGSILGKSYVGLGNASLDLQGLFDDLAAAAGSKLKIPFTFSNVRGTSEAGNFAVFLMSYREPDLTVRGKPHDLQMRDSLCEDTPAWWLLKKKKTMYHTGTHSARSVRSIMQFMLSPTNAAAVFDKEEATFRDVQAYLLSLEAPKYPFAINRELAAGGEKLFGRTCATCHGTYGARWTYPNKIVPIDEIGTDRKRHDGFSPVLTEFYNKSWFAKEKRADGQVGYPATDARGYQAPPLDGVWATAPYLHNGSVPTLYHVLNSKSRPRIFRRSYRTDKEDYDTANVGWRVQVLERGVDGKMSGHEQRRIYDTTQPGRGNGGHTFGDDLTEEQRRAVIEYLKTL
jgi:mono/diheme cytochrome c family protein